MGTPPPPAPGTQGTADVLLSLGNHIFAAAAAYLLAKGWNNGTLEMLQGIVMAVVSFGIAFWQNSAGTTLDLVQSFLRRILTIILAFAATRGWLSGDVGSAVVNGFGTLFPIIWSVIFNRSAPGPSLPGTTVVDPQ